MKRLAEMVKNFKIENYYLDLSVIGIAVILFSIPGIIKLLN